MNLATLFWILMLLWLLFGAWRGYSVPAERPWFVWGLIPFLLFVIIGLKLFGSPIQG